MMEVDLKPFSDEKELAELLGVRRNTLAKWRCSGGGPPYIKMCGRVRYSREDVRTWLSRHRQGGGVDTDR